MSGLLPDYMIYKIMDCKHVLRMLVISTWIILLICSICSGIVLDEERLHTYLKQKYGEAVRPVADRTKPLILNATVYFIKLIGLNEKEQEYEYAATLNLVWWDPKVKWNASDFGGHEHTVISTKVLPVWLPDISLYNGVDIDETYDLSQSGIFNLKINRRGRIVWFFGHSFRTICKMDIKYFPFDTQVCTSTFLCPTMQKHELEFLAPIKTIMNDYPPDNGEWVMIRNRTYTGVTYRRFSSGIIEGKNNFNAEMVLRRKSLYYILNLIIPTTAVSVLILMVYCLPPDCTEKVSLGITVLLTFSVFQLMVAENLPSSSDEVSILGVYLLWQMILSAISVIMSVAVLNITTRDKKMPKSIRLLLFRYIAGVVGLREDAKAYDFSVCDTSPKADAMKFENQTFDSSTRSVVDVTNKKVEDEGCCKHLKRLMQQLKTYFEILKAKAEGEDVKDEWKMAARIIDRLLLISSAAVLGISTIIFVCVLSVGEHRE